VIRATTFVLELAVSAQCDAIVTHNVRDFEGVRRFSVRVRVSAKNERLIMSVLSLRLPDSIHEKARELAKREAVSLNQFIALAVAEKMSALLTHEYLNERARRGNKQKFHAILARVADVPPDAGDELPDGRRSRRRSSEAAKKGLSQRPSRLRSSR
jgi:hypothetical protein